MGTAQGLFYLHEDSGLRVVHGDLKLSNILLDVKMNAKISGFALARSRTTYGNMSTSESYVQMKSDVYRFGVIVLAMVSGRRLTTDLDITSLVDNTWELWYKGLELAVVDKSIIGTRGVDNEERRCIRVGLLCTLKNLDDRPAMSLVLKILEEEVVSLQTNDDDLASSSSDNENDTEGNTVTLELDDDVAIL
ncbi:PREDICTED: putative receptor-like protein kinase At4g00960 [Erythranthe guttata]|uniref:putative receptor-like protein kinase At4g00960 n=1 Tax=Erythranthe guttata TaxID=4155 RepID=UPI00064DE403|nr:PREDICTED: putative receptor-like protein kinase At4g00960 [Erythranthe guttata]|eukprot:XP_012834070.1 PREDICTED: putative receptor-like protein kinase At4g00960 [Erythranthe guttata]